jgi:hypothetical protein
VLVASVGSLYERAVVDTGREPEFIFLISFLASFGFIRTSAHLIRAQVSWWPGNVEVGGTHVHHLVWGILLLLVAGYVGVVVSPDSPWHEIFIVLFGIGTGLTLDEFALWLNLRDVYWEEEGRRSIDAVIVAGAIAAIAVTGFGAWVEVATEVESEVFAAVGAVGAIGLAVVLVNAAKEHYVGALVAFFLPPIGIVSALRLAKPRSLWARLFYSDAKRVRAQLRYAAGD